MYHVQIYVPKSFKSVYLEYGMFIFSGFPWGYLCDNMPKPFPSLFCQYFWRFILSILMWLSYGWRLKVVLWREIKAVVRLLTWKQTVSDSNTILPNLLSLFNSFSILEKKNSSRKCLWAQATQPIPADNATHFQSIYPKLGSPCFA